jgi:hypothetical protein
VLHLRHAQKQPHLPRENRHPASASGRTNIRYRGSSRSATGVTPVLKNCDLDSCALLFNNYDTYLQFSTTAKVFLLKKMQQNDCSQPGGDRNAKHYYEDEAQESDNAFIDDDDVDPDESNSEAAEMTREVISSMRNRQQWKRSQELPCRLCNDLRHVLRYLLDLQ